MYMKKVLKAKYMTLVSTYALLINLIDTFFIWQYQGSTLHDMNQVENQYTDTINKLLFQFNHKLTMACDKTRIVSNDILVKQRIQKARVEEAVVRQLFC